MNLTNISAIYPICFPQIPSMDAPKDAFFYNWEWLL